MPPLGGSESQISPICVPVSNIKSGNLPIPASHFDSDSTCQLNERMKTGSVNNDSLAWLHPLRFMWCISWHNENVTLKHDGERSKLIFHWALLEVHTYC